MIIISDEEGKAEVRLGLRIVDCIEGLKPRLNGHPVVKLLLPVLRGESQSYLSLTHYFVNLIKIILANGGEELFNKYSNIIKLTIHTLDFEYVKKIDITFR